MVEEHLQNALKKRTVSFENVIQLMPQTLKKALTDQIAKKGAKMLVNEDFELGRLVKVVMAMVFLSLQEIVQVWEDIINIEYSRNDDVEEEFDNIYDYFEGTYIGNTNRHGRRSRLRIENGLRNHFGRIQQGGE
ncbi:unnamed protein product [Lepeophtheirus salmonis]|uniref:(salmon louse) hypothetical protein n=1 Tax=Lepeophtheirus salmonis TaxID=72036 RepID=A0A7R8CL96_LEPSM|nr:unnamed protein product [Lepeophtheirus salmonis]CAF2852182.1 unnamed protein product [Lepeophtheirus salmonis]